MNSNVRIATENESGDGASIPAPADNIAVQHPENHVNNSAPGANRDDQDQVQQCATAARQRGVCSRYFGNVLIQIDEEDPLYQSIKLMFLSGLNSQGLSAQVVAIHMNFSNIKKQARAQAFNIFLQTMTRMHGGDANVARTWYGASKDGNSKTIKFEFGDSRGNGIYGRGFYLSAAAYPADSILTSPVLENGLRHLLL